MIFFAEKRCLCSRREPKYILSLPRTKMHFDTDVNQMPDGSRRGTAAHPLYEPRRTPLRNLSAFPLRTRPDSGCGDLQSAADCGRRTVHGTAVLSCRLLRTDGFSNTTFYPDTKKARRLVQRARVFSKSFYLCRSRFRLFQVYGLYFSSSEMSFQ